MPPALATRFEAGCAVTANIAHELRTSVAGLLTASSLLMGATVPPRVGTARPKAALS